MLLITLIRNLLASGLPAHWYVSRIRLCFKKSTQNVEILPWYAVVFKKHSIMREVKHKIIQLGGSGEWFLARSLVLRNRWMTNKVLNVKKKKRYIYLRK